MVLDGEIRQRDIEGSMRRGMPVSARENHEGEHTNGNDDITNHEVVLLNNLMFGVSRNIDLAGSDNSRPDA